MRKYTKKENDVVTSFSFVQKSFECEVCKDPLPYIIDFYGEKIELIELQRRNNPYIILENISR